MLEPRVAFSGHSHNYCRVKNLLEIEEYTISSYSWRNKNNPKFLLVRCSGWTNLSQMNRNWEHSFFRQALFTPTDYHVAVCDMPKESTVYAVYTIGSIVSVLMVFYMEFMSRSGTNYAKVVGKSNWIKFLCFYCHPPFTYTHFASNSLMAAFRLPYSPPFTKLTPVFLSQPPLGALSCVKDWRKK